MRNILMLLLIIFGGTHIVNAASGMLVHAGFNMSNAILTGSAKVPDSLDADQSSRMGYSVGAQVEIDMNGYLAFSTGLSLEARGYRVADERVRPFDTVTTKITEKLTYINIPIHVKFLASAGPGKITAALGPEIGILISGKRDIDSSTTAGTGAVTESTMEVGDIRRTIVVGLGGQLAYEYPIGVNAIVGGIGYSYDFSSSEDNNKYYDTRETEWKKSNTSPFEDSTEGKAIKALSGGVNNTNLKFFLGFKVKW